MNFEVIVTCAVTGAGDTVGKHPGVPVTPEQIAQAAIDAAKHGSRAWCVKNTLTGVAWAVLRPVLAMGAFTLVFHRLAGLDELQVARRRGKFLEVFDRLIVNNKVNIAR